MARVRRRRSAQPSTSRARWRVRPAAPPRPEANTKRPASREAGRSLFWYRGCLVADPLVVVAVRVAVRDVDVAVVAAGLGDALLGADLGADRAVIRGSCAGEADRKGDQIGRAHV